MTRKATIKKSAPKKVSSTSSKVAGPAKAASKEAKRVVSKGGAVNKLAHLAKAAKSLLGGGNKAPVKPQSKNPASGAKSAKAGAKASPAKVNPVKNIQSKKPTAPQTAKVASPKAAAKTSTKPGAATVTSKTNAAILVQAAVPAKGAKAKAEPSKAGATKGSSKASANAVTVDAQMGANAVTKMLAGKAASTARAARAARGGGRGGSLRKLDGSEVICREIACEGLSTSGGYCRLHYIKNWRKIKRKEVILSEKKLNQYLEELVGKYPDKYLEAILLDLATDKEFAKVIRDLDLDEGPDEEFEEDSDSDVIIDSIKREFEEDAEGF